MPIQDRNEQIKSERNPYKTGFVDAQGRGYMLKRSTPPEKAREMMHAVEGQIQEGTGQQIVEQAQASHRANPYAEPAFSGDILQLMQAIQQRKAKGGK